MFVNHYVKQGLIIIVKHVIKKQINAIHAIQDIIYHQMMKKKNVKNAQILMINAKNVMEQKILLNVYHVKMALFHFMMKIMKF